MKKETILKRLYDIKNYNMHDEFKGLNEIKFNKLIDDLKEDITKENLPEGSSKKQYTAIKRFLNQKWLDSRPVLKLTHIEDERQIFTDSYVLFRFTGDSIIYDLPQTKKESNYPQTKDLCEPTFNSSLKSPDYSIKDLKNQIRTSEKTIDIKLNETQKAKIDKKKLKQAIDIMNFKNKDVIQFNYLHTNHEYTIRPIAIVTDTRECLIVPLRTN